MVEAKMIMPIYKIEKDCILSRQGDVTVGFKVSLPEIFTLSDREYESYHQSWVKAIKLLPETCMFHKQDWFVKGRFKADFDSAGDSFLGRSSERFFKERECLDHSCYIFLTRKAGGRLSSSALSNVLRKSIAPAQTTNQVLVDEFLDAAGQFVRIMQDSGFVSLQRLGDNELAGTANFPGVLERYCFLLAEGEPSVIRDIHLRDEIRVGEKHCWLFTLSNTEDLPSMVGSRINYDKYSTDRTKFSVGFASPLGQLLNCNHIYNQYIFLGDSSLTLKRLEAKKLRLQSLSAYSRENAISRDAVNDFLNEAIAGGKLPVKSHFNVLCWSEDEGEMKEAGNMVSSAMAQMDAVAKLESDGKAQVWFAGLPGNEADFAMNDTFDTFLEQASCFFNLESNYRSSVSPFGVRLGDRLSGRPVHVDISDEPISLGIATNRNKFILGPSGSGKSFLTNHLMRSYAEQGAHVVIVDVGHSYSGLCELMGGYYFTYSESSPIAFNPFYLGEGEVMDTEKKESIKTLLLALWKKDDETFTRSEYVALSGALSLYFEYLGTRHDIFPCFNSFYEYLQSGYGAELERRRVKASDFDIGNFIYVLSPFYRGGEFDYLLNARENLDLLAQPFIVFELDNIKDHPILFPVVTLIIMEVFISKMRKLKGVRKVFLCEEAWKAIAKEGMAEQLKYLFKTVRKHFGEAIVVTQEVEDIISSPIVKQAIINNSDCKILLDQSKYQNKFDQIQELLGLTDKEKAQVLSLNKANDAKRKYKEVFISIGGQMSKVYRTEVSLEEYLCYTTEEREKLRVSEYAGRYGSMQRGIAALAAEIRAKPG
ncbi:TraG family conjugative transposon ATPase [Pedobacter aquatilis]|uniref:TraG family conjugative transposon ATPase n=1 Tax=Pedobacter aquatilis TaxID=351343 RepID=UPI0025B329C2|nr:TraG family conjugative transposon ATPase [Pedobacter aquatilis]MDN3588127.1 TraG family conjugative transposon ATPase [Pedobacter aquatilis]